MTLAHSGKVCSVRIHLGLGPPISGGCDPSNIGAHAQKRGDALTPCRITQKVLSETLPSHAALGLGVRAWVARSTATRPNLGTTIRTGSIFEMQLAIG